MAERRPYPSDLFDARRELIEPVLSAWRAERRRYALNIGRPPEHDLREIMNALLYVDRTGVQWRYLPHDFPPFQTCYGYFAKWQKDGVFAQLTGVLRRLLRQWEGKEAEPSACVIDAQSVKTSTSVPAAGQGTDAAKKIVGRKRSIVTDTLGLLLAVLVTAASVQDSVAGTHLVDQVAAAHPTIRKVWVDGGYRQHLVEHAAQLGIDMEIIQPKPRYQRLHSAAQALDRGAHVRMADVPPPSGPRLRDLARPLRSHDPPRHDRPDCPPPHRRSHHLLARPDTTGSNANSGMKHREKTTS